MPDGIKAIPQQVTEDYPGHHRPLPDCLVLGWLVEGRPITIGQVTEQLAALVRRVKDVQTKVAIVVYPVQEKVYV